MRVVNRRFVSSDGRMAVEVSSSCFRGMLTMVNAAKGDETGSVLIGHYSDDGHLAVVESTRPSPKGSVRLRSSFLRTATGLKTFFENLFARSNGKRYYIGEWHLHPNSSVEPSPTDDATMSSISSDQNKNGMISIILGGVPDKRLLIGVYVYHGSTRTVLR